MWELGGCNLHMFGWRPFQFFLKETIWSSQGEESSEEGDDDQSNESSNANDGCDSNAGSSSDSEESEDDAAADSEMKLTRQSIEQLSENISEETPTYYDNGLKNTVLALQILVNVHWPMVFEA